MKPLQWFPIVFTLGLIGICVAYYVRFHEWGALLVAAMIASIAIGAKLWRGFRQ